ncbi:MAG: UDP-N-acetylmuramoyl-tripeptide--D-alanyl-D-alanine ligase [Thermodesulfovibrionales bacterium]|nr:UDP-N-acetylmuramoyl-tripeptide--D-alanyl-D-alanine ligase [Thermodesulfovibrionales bacterium]
MANILLLIIGVATIGTLLLITILRLIMFLHMLQLEGYRSERFIKWLTRNPDKILTVTTIKDPKKKLVFTARATRLFILTLMLLTLVIYNLSELSLIIFMLGVFLVGLFVPFLVLLSSILIYPLETVINNLYLRSAKKKIKKLKPKVIAITGSYGKTSTKDFLASILSTQYRVLKTPGSFNTPMGICKIIRGDLRPDHEIFIVEMGARQKGDIKELCELVEPEMGIITAIGLQHLEMFKTIENIINTKYELVESLPANGIAIFNNDDENCRQLADRTHDKEVLRYGINENEDKLHLMARDISTSSQGIYFMAQNSKGDAVPFHCKLLSKHNVYNILAAATVALECRMSLNEIAEAIQMLEPSPHRLQLIRGAGGVIVIDDAFNANPVGAKMALEVLSEFKGGRKVLVTPGLVELGEREYEENKQIGIAAAKVCDFVFLIGTKKTRPIFEGLKEAGFPETNIFVEKNLNGATKKIKDILKVGDVVLFENDLPDTYNE